MLLLNPKHLIIILFSFLFLNSCSTKNENILKPVGYEQENTITIENGNLKVVFVDNKEAGPVHLAGYNGIAELRHTDEDSLIFVPVVAGFNLEHIFGGDRLVELFEPRRHPMMLFRKSDNEVLLYQQATPISGVESLTEFKVVKPNYIDITFRCILHDQHFFQHDYAGLFWASYINHPEDKKIYFRGTTEDKQDISWIGAYSVKHGLNSTHKGIEDDYDFYFAENFNAILASHYSEFRYTAPFYFGKFRGMALAYLFDTKEIIRFSQSPDGAGETNPAWDFQYLIPSPKIGKEYTFKARIIYKPFISKEDIHQEYESWKREGKRVRPENYFSF